MTLNKVQACSVSANLRLNGYSRTVGCLDVQNASSALVSATEVLERSVSDDQGYTAQTLKYMGKVLCCNVLKCCLAVNYTP